MKNQFVEVSGTTVDHNNKVAFGCSNGIDVLVGHYWSDNYDGFS